MSRVPAIFDDLARASLPDRPVHLAIGMFDGVHRGHQAVIASAVAGALRSGGVAGVFTFWPHPSRLLRPEAPTAMMLARPGRRALLVAQGIDFVVEQEFSRAFAGIEADAFAAWLHRWLPRLETIHVGENWRFGHDRRGDVPLLSRLAEREGIAVVAVPRVHADGSPISSSRIRHLVQAGDMQEVSRLLGRPYRAEGTVVGGRQLGRTLGFPTLNLDWQPELPPHYGVYAVRVGPAEGGGTRQPGVANWGVRPTVAGEAGAVLEVHLLGACPFDAGARLGVDWIALLRVEQRFPDLDALRAQIARDRDAAAALLSAVPRFSGS